MKKEMAAILIFSALTFAFLVLISLALEPREFELKNGQKVSAYGICPLASKETECHYAHISPGHYLYIYTYFEQSSSGATTNEKRIYGITPLGFE